MLELGLQILFRVAALPLPLPLGGGRGRPRGWRQQAGQLLLVRFLRAAERVPGPGSGRVARPHPDGGRSPVVRTELNRLQFL